MYLVSLFSNRTVCYTLILIHLYSDGDKSVWLETSVSVSSGNKLLMLYQPWLWDFESHSCGCGWNLCITNTSHSRRKSSTILKETRERYPTIWQPAARLFAALLRCFPLSLLFRWYHIALINPLLNTKLHCISLSEHQCVYNIRLGVPLKRETESWKIERKKE